MSKLLLSKLNAVRRRHAAVSFSRALVGVIGLIILCLAIGMLLDRWLELSYFWRAVLLSIDSAAAITLLVWHGLLPIVRGPDVEQAALWVEREEPSFRSRLISVIQFGQPHMVMASASPAMVRELVRETESLSANVNFTRVVHTEGLARLAMVTIIGVAVVVSGAVYAGPQSIPLLERALLVPNIPMPRRTQIDCETQNITIAKGDPVTIAVDCAGVIPPSGLLKVDYESGSSTTLPLDAVNGNPAHFNRLIDNVQGSFSYTVFLGDNHSQTYRVETVVRPAVVNLKCVQVYPQYTKLAPEAMSPWDLTLLAGSRLAISVKANKLLKIASDVHGNHIHLIGSEADFPLMGDINDLSKLHAIDGSSPSIPILPGTTGFSVELVDQNGIRSKDSLVYRIDLVADRPPVVRIIEPAARQQTITSVAKPTIEITADDDFAVGRLALRYRITKAGQTGAVQDDPNGLTATYFNSLDFSGPGVSRIEPAIDVDWSAGTHVPGIGEHFSVRWTGQIRPVYSEKYRFKCLAGDGERMWVDGKLASERWPHNAVNAEGQDIFLQAGRLYPITIDCRQEVGDPDFRFQWWSPKTGPQVIPHTALFHRSGPLPKIDPMVDSLVAYWTLDDDDDGFAHDSVAGADGTVYNATRAPGRIGRAIQFAGPDQRVEISATQAMQFHSYDSFTLSAWVEQKKHSTNWQGVVTKSRDGGSWYGIWIDNTGHFASASPSQILQGASVTPGWHLVTIVQDGNAKTRTIYVDGVAGQSGKSQEANGWGAMVFGGGHGTIEPFNGLVDDVRLYARPLPIADIQQMFHNPKAAAIPTLADLGGTNAGAAASMNIDLAGQTPKSVDKKIVWDLAQLGEPLGVDDTVEFWAEAADNNDVTVPGIGSSEHHQFHVISEADKEKELMDKLGDYMGKVRDVSDSERDLNAKTGTMVKP
jgi:hypothetical protein